MQENTIPSEPASAGSAQAASASSAQAAPAEATSTDAYASVRRFVEAVRDTFTVSTVYGDPVEAHGVTVIPVARTYFGFGGGGGGGHRQETGGGGGGGGGGTVRPIGFIEITESGARWVPITPPELRIALRVLPAIVALLAGQAIRRRLRREPAED